jgi:hypothetical protein
VAQGEINRGKSTSLRGFKGFFFIFFAKKCENWSDMNYDQKSYFLDKIDIY